MVCWRVFSALLVLSILHMEINGESEELDDDFIEDPYIPISKHPGLLRKRRYSDPYQPNEPTMLGKIFFDKIKKVAKLVDKKTKLFSKFSGPANYLSVEEDPFDGGFYPWTTPSKSYSYIKDSQVHHPVKTSKPHKKTYTVNHKTSHPTYTSSTKTYSPSHTSSKSYPSTSEIHSSRSHSYSSSSSPSSSSKSYTSKTHSSKSSSSRIPSTSKSYSSSISSSSSSSSHLYSYNSPESLSLGSLPSNVLESSSSSSTLSSSQSHSSSLKPSSSSSSTNSLLTNSESGSISSSPSDEFVDEVNPGAESKPELENETELEAEVEEGAHIEHEENSEELELEPKKLKIDTSPPLFPEDLSTLYGYEKGLELDDEYGSDIEDMIDLIYTEDILEHQQYDQKILTMSEKEFEELYDDSDLDDDDFDEDDYSSKDTENYEFENMLDEVYDARKEDSYHDNHISVLNDIKSLMKVASSASIPLKAIDEALKTIAQNVEDAEGDEDEEVLKVISDIGSVIVAKQNYLITDNEYKDAMKILQADLERLHISEIPESRTRSIHSLPVNEPLGRSHSYSEPSESTYSSNSQYYPSSFSYHSPSDSSSSSSSSSASLPSSNARLHASSSLPPSISSSSQPHASSLKESLASETPIQTQHYFDNIHIIPINQSPKATSSTGADSTLFGRKESLNPRFGPTTINENQKNALDKMTKNLESIAKDIEEAIIKNEATTKYFEEEISEFKATPELVHQHGSQQDEVGELAYLVRDRNDPSKQFLVPASLLENFQNGV